MMSRALPFLAVLLLTGCLETLMGPAPTAPLPMYVPPPAADISLSNYAAADALLEQMRPSVPAATPLVVATVVDINSLEDSSPLGRLMTEQISGRMSQGGYRVIEVKLRSQLFMKRSEGELMLARELRDVAKRHSASIAVTGTYTDSAKRVFVNLKAIRLDDNVVVGAVDYELPRDAQVKSLLGGSAAAGPVLK